MKYILTHDIGTAGNRAALHSTDGTLHGSCHQTWRTLAAEQNPDEWWYAVRDCTKQLLGNIDASDVIAVSFSGHVSGFVCVDENGAPLRNSMPYYDCRATAENDMLLEKIDALSLYRITGHRAIASYPLQKLLWIKNNEPDVYKHTYKVLQPKDYAAFRLTGNMYTDYSGAGETQSFDILQLDWSDEILSATGLDDEKLPEAKSAEFVCGEVTTRAAAETGLAAGTPVVIGAGGGCSSAVGCGSVASQHTYTMLDFSACVGTTTKKPVYDETMRTVTIPHAAPGLYHSFGVIPAAGAGYDWAKKLVLADDVPVEALDEEIAKSTVGAGGILFLPCQLGARAPWWDDDAKGAFIGLRLSTTKNDMLRAVLEGIAFNLLLVLDSFRSHLKPGQMVLAGSGADSKTFQKIVADVYGMKLEIPRDAYLAPCMGAAAIAGVGIGEFSDLEAAAGVFYRKESVCVPYETNHDAYESLYPVLRDSYRQLKDIFTRI